MRPKRLDQFTKPPIFIGGCGRSGTTLLLSMLSAHPEIYCIAEETMAFCPTAYNDVVDLQAPFTVAEFYENYFPDDIPDTCNRWCEKTPKNILYFDRILDYFKGHVHLVNIVRDGRDVILSKHPTNKSTYWVDPERWITEVNIGLKYENHPKVITIRYEDLILDYETTMRSICAFVGIEYNNQIDNWHKHTAVRNNVAWSDNVRPIFTGSIRKWEKKLTWKQRRRLKRFMKDQDVLKLLEHYHYL